MNNIFVLNKNYKKIGALSNQGANPQAPYFNDLYVQELETGADTYEFSTISSKYTQDLLEIGNHIMFAYKNRNELFTITSLEYSHNEGYKTIGVYAEGIGFDLLEVFMKRPANEKDNNSGNNSGSGGSSGGNDSDGDGDDNTDNEYADPDDVYIDENGNIIYDKYGQDDYADPDNVTIDGDGNIIYKRSKNNKKNDSLEFKNISYSRFLSIVLKGTGWSYVCQPGLESVKHDISVKYDRNIYAVLQDSMQSYRGVELEFVHEYNGGSVQKIIKAYKDGGRGSFIGKRFEYGTNVRGITKMQEVANSEDDTVLRIDNVGIDVRYDIDFALKSAEVPEIEIGDTHYVIDKDFYPPMTIKARIGKIEVSFSDPTRNKIYLANNKRISGSAIDDELNKDDIKDMIDDYDSTIDDSDNDYVPDHTHYELVNTVSSDTIGFYGDSFSAYKDRVYDLGDSAYWWRNLYVNQISTNKISFSDGTSMTTAGSSSGGGAQFSMITHEGEYFYEIPYGIYIPNNGSTPLLIGGGYTGRDIINANKLTAGVIFCEGDQVTDGIIQCSRLVCKNPQMNSDKSLKENIRYIDAPIAYNNNDLLEKVDLYNFIVNQVNICEYNYIGSCANKIGFIANDYEGTKVGDKIVSKDKETELLSYDISNLLFATIGALQEEVRTKDEQIASLEARLAKIEAMLDINNE